MNVEKLNVTFDEKKLFIHVMKENSFSNGLIMYLEELKIQLKKELCHNADAFTFVLQTYIELGSLVYPDPSHCYSLIPREVNQIDWNEGLKNGFVANSSNPKLTILIELESCLNIKFGNCNQL